MDYNRALGEGISRDPINEPGSKLLRGERPKYRVDGELIDDMRLDEEMNLYHFVFNNPINRIDYLGLGHNFGRCCNRSGGNEWALLDGKWRQLKPGECTGIFEDCDGMTCGGGFYYVSALEWAACVTPGCDSPPFNNRRWEPGGGGDGGGRPPGGPGGRGSSEGNTTVAEYDTESGTFTHKLQGVAYSKKDADVDQRDAAFWNLAGIQRRE